MGKSFALVRLVTESSRLGTAGDVIACEPVVAPAHAPAFSPARRRLLLLSILGLPVYFAVVWAVVYFLATRGFL